MKCNSQYLGVIPVPPVGIQMYGSPWQTKPGVFISDLRARPLMSALGQKQTCAAQKVMSALPPKADIVCDKVRTMNPVTIASVRAHGVRQLLVYCNGKRDGDWPCHHSGQLPSEQFSARFFGLPTMRWSSAAAYLAAAANTFDYLL